MYFVYNIEEYNYHPREYYNEREISDIPLTKFDTLEEIEEFLKENEHYWPVHSLLTYSWVPVNCADENEAREHLLDTLNQAVYERINDC